ncbi:imidazole glycerol phosphate synthase subunit HisF [Niveispirillum fermenti]|uniref:imidazole glycerol phosphate synthase subunit HisF n=1 Tax=Niveispirillum fermenti TaxID=1233113 RepID=UPI003A864EDE
MTPRLIARLDIKGRNLIKGIQLEGLRVLGDPADFARRHYRDGIDELIYMDAVASLYQRNSLADIVSHTARDVFVPLTVGGGVRTVEDARVLLRAGADKIAINTAAIARPALITEISRHFGSQCMVLSIDAKRMGPDRWMAYTDNGREPSGLDVVQWARQAEELGAGEILLTSVDREGTRKGLDTALTLAVSAAVGIPVIASGGVGDAVHVVEGLRIGQASAIAMADLLHYGRVPLSAVRQAITEAGMEIRTP